MIRKLCLASILAALVAALVSAPVAFAHDQRMARLDANGNNLDALIARHAAANNLPENLIRRVIKRESGGNARAVSKGSFGLMQIRLRPPPRSGCRGGAPG